MENPYPRFAANELFGVSGSWSLGYCLRVYYLKMDVKSSEGVKKSRYAQLDGYQRATPKITAVPDRRSRLSKLRPFTLAWPSLTATTSASWQ